MITERIEPESLTRAALDDYLARGFYRIGRSMITAELLMSDGDVRSAVWTRLDLDGYRFRRSLRKRMARNYNRFQVTVGDFVLDEERERLYSRYRASVEGSRAKTLDEVTGGVAGRALFHTREIAIRHNGELVGFSWFDLGETSVQSLIGVYHPEYAKHGLGFWTMLLEIEHAVSIGMRYHYAGYVLAEPSGMDYKKQVGALEHFNPVAKTWQAAFPFPGGQSPAEIQRRRIGEAEAAHRAAGSIVTRVFNSALAFPSLQELVPQCVRVPILLVCTAPDPFLGVLTTWDETLGRFVFFSGKPISVPVTSEAGDTPSEPFQVDLFIPYGRLGESESAEEIAVWTRHFLALHDSDDDTSR